MKKINRSKNALNHFFLYLIIKAKNVVTLSVDDIFAQPGIGVPGVSSTDTKHGLFIGGHPKPERLTALRVHHFIIVFYSIILSLIIGLAEMNDY